MRKFYQIDIVSLEICYSALSVPVANRKLRPQMKRKRKQTEFLNVKTLEIMEAVIAYESMLLQLQKIAKSNEEVICI